jgi:murein L,D-transpeptidase YcbB/YkuD
MQHFCRRLTFIAIVIAPMVLAACTQLHVGRGSHSSADDRRSAVQSRIRHIVHDTARPAYVTRGPDGTRLWKLTRTFYERREFVPAWIEDGVPTSHIDALLRAIESADSDGLDPELYGAGLLHQRKTEASSGFLTHKGFDLEEAAAMDVWLTRLYMSFGSDLADGIVDLARADPTWKIERTRFDPLSELQRALADNRVAESLLQLTPATPDYLALRAVLKAYREQANSGGWPRVPANARLKPDESSPVVPALAARLAASGDLPTTEPSSGEPSRYGSELQDAVKRFQRRHGLTDDGVVGPAVVAELNVPIETRIRQIELNMERWRWLPRDLGDPHILVNIPEMRLDVWDHGSTPVSMRVVVGKTDTPTPIFNGRMTYVVLAPFWNVPADIAQKETLPAILNDPGFLARTNMEVVDNSGRAVSARDIDLSTPDRYRFRQRPGTSNALGLVKFMFPNQFNVYLHDTPADSLFSRASRSFSHGCVRVEEPDKLVQYVLRDQPEWTTDRITEAMHAAEERVVKLKTAIPIYLGYWTARVTPDHVVQFRKDVYGIDGRQAATLAARLEAMKASAAAARASLAPSSAGTDAATSASVK